MDFLIILLVIFFFAFSIFIHEFGHFIAAIWRGLYVEKFSIGFGPKLWGFKYKGIEFLISVLPLGGYVALPQMVPEDGEVVASDGRKLAPITPLDKIITAVAGPLFNIIFAFLLSILVWQIGKPSLVPIDRLQVASIEQNSPEYIAGVRQGDLIKAINGQSFVDYQDLLEKFITANGQITLDLVRSNKALKITYKPKLNEKYESLAFPFMQFSNPPIIGLVEKGGIADQAGLKNGDLIKSVNNKKVFSLIELNEAFKLFGHKQMSITIERQGAESTVKLISKQKISYRIGVLLEQNKEGLQIVELVSGGVAELAGLKTNDIISKIKGKIVTNLLELKSNLTNSQEIKLSVLRDGKEEVFSLTPQKHIYYDFGANYNVAYVIAYPTPYEQFKRVISSTYRTLGSLFSSQSSVKVKHMSSVIGISKGLFDQIKILGIMAGVGFLILLNISLAILNLLPLPVLDGGHIVLALIEKITGREVPAKVLRPVLTIFTVLLMSFMVYVMYQDTLRLFK